MTSASVFSLKHYLVACVFSLASWDVHADNVSFYGKRNIVVEDEAALNPVEFHRRAIAPAFIEEAVDVDVDVDADVVTSNENLPILATAQAPEQHIYTLTRNEKLLAKKAQYYVEQNRRPETGLWDSVSGYAHTTMWDVASGIAATLALEALEMKTSEATLYELSKTIQSLHHLPLYNNQLPNREYSTKTGQPSGRLSETESNGNGWSALDIGRLLIWLDILRKAHPSLEHPIEQLVKGWDLKRAVNNNTLYGAKLYKGKEYYRQEGRYGYLQYAIKGFQLFGYNVDVSEAEEHIRSVIINNIEVKRDTRNVPFFTSDPYILSALEFGQDPQWNQLDSIYQLHKNYWDANQALISFGEDAMDKNPWFAYNNIYYYKKPWTSVSSSGKPIENPQQFSHKIAYGFSVLYDDAFSEALALTVIEGNRPFRSISTGIYEDGGSNTAFNINTNSLILVSMWYQVLGKRPILTRY